MPGSIIFEPHGINKSLTHAELCELEQYLAKRKAEMEVNKAYVQSVMSEYEDYFRALMDRVDPNTPEGHAQMNRIYQQWTGIRAACDGRPMTQPHTPLPAPALHLDEVSIAAAPDYSLGHHSSPYIPLSPLFGEDDRRGRDVSDSHRAHPRSASPSTARPRTREATSPRLARSPFWEPHFQHVAFYTHQPQLADQILTEGYRSTVDAIDHDDTTLAEAFSRLLVEQTVRLMVEPGHYRPGQGGSDEAVWGKAAVGLAELARAGRHIPQVSPWGRMGMDVGAPRSPIQVQPIRHRNRVQNPYNFPLDFFPKYGSALHGSVYRLILHMKIPVTSIVAAIWFLEGLPFHDGDGLSGHEFRLHFRNLARQDPRQAVKHALTIGLLLAGKWLDDNAYHNKTWSEMSRIPVSEIDYLEKLTMKHFHFSLNLSGPAWLAHVSKQVDGLSLRPHDNHAYVLATQMHHMLNAAEESEAQINRQVDQIHTSAYYAQRYFSDSIYARQHTTMQSSEESYVHESYDSGVEEVDAQLGSYHERYVSALVDEDEADTSFDDAISEFIDYDGAQPWITRDHLRRSASMSSSAMDSGSIDQWRGDIKDSHVDAWHTEPAHAPLQVAYSVDKSARPYQQPTAILGASHYTNSTGHAYPHYLQDPSDRSREEYVFTQGPLPLLRGICG